MARRHKCRIGGQQSCGRLPEGRKQLCQPVHFVQSRTPQEFFIPAMEMFFGRM
jgi:hypothetical protein